MLGTILHPVKNPSDISAMVHTQLLPHCVGRCGTRPIECLIKMEMAAYLELLITSVLVCGSVSQLKSMVTSSIMVDTHLLVSGSPKALYCTITVSHFVKELFKLCNLFTVCFTFSGIYINPCNTPNLSTVNTIQFFQSLHPSTLVF